MPEFAQPRVATERAIGTFVGFGSADIWLIENDLGPCAVSRNPDGPPAFCARLIEAFAESAPVKLSENA